MVTKKVRYKDSKGKVYEYDIGAKAENVEEDATRRFASDTEKEKWNGKIGTDTQIEFTEATGRQNINTKETIETILGKVKKFFTDLKPHAFYDLVQNATTAAVDRAVSAAVAKNLQDQINAQNTNKVSYPTSGTFLCFFKTINSRVVLYVFLPIDNDKQYSLGSIKVWASGSEMGTQNTFSLVGKTDSGLCFESTNPDVIYYFETVMNANAIPGTADISIY